MSASQANTWQDGESLVASKQNLQISTNGAHLLTTRASIKGGKPYSAECWYQTQLAVPATIQRSTTQWSR